MGGTPWASDSDGSQTNARVFSLSPAVTVPILARNGPKEVRDALSALGIESRGPAKLAAIIARSDLGKYFSDELQPTSEDRGHPADKSRPAFELLGEKGFTAGKDKDLNRAMAEALRSFFNKKKIDFESVESETTLKFCSLIPDNSVHVSGQVACVEYTWRSRDFLASGHKASVAKYLLKKLRAYARELGWTSA